jgi:hypothetical protein
MRMEKRLGMGDDVSPRREGGGEFWQRLTLPVEEKGREWWWDGSYRWFRSSNVIPLERYRGSVEMARIRKILLGRRS